MFVDFNKDEMTSALKFAEELRKDQREGNGVRHVSISCENTDSVGHPGVDVTGPEYNWKKRRI